MPGSIARSTGALAVALLIAVPALAGDVTAKVKGETLTLKGDDLGADLSLSLPVVRGVPVGVVVDPADGTTLNGGVDPIVFAAVANMKITLGDGPNDVQFNGLVLVGSLTFKSGNEADTLTFVASGFQNGAKISLGDGVNELAVDVDSTFGDDLRVKSRSGVDEVILDGVVSGKVKIALGDGVNSFESGGSVTGDVSFKSGNGVDTVTLSDAAWAQDFSVNLGGGVNDLTLDTTSGIGGSLKLKAGAGVDTVTVTDSAIGGDASLGLSAGSNTVTLTDVTVAGDLIVKAKDGFDTVTFAGAVDVVGAVIFKTGGGGDVLPPF